MTENSERFPSRFPLQDGSALPRCTECGIVQFDPTDHYEGCSLADLGDTQEARDGSG